MYTIEVYSKDMGDMVAIECEGFDWDPGNIGKNWKKHGVTDGEIEQIFFNRPLIVSLDIKHSSQEERVLALGQTEIHRLLLVVFSIRNKLIRAISARHMNRKERKEYKNYEETDSQI